MRPSSLQRIEIRDERPADRDLIREINRQAFGQEQEGRIIDALRERGAVLLSLVAILDGSVVGHILLSPVSLGSVVGAGLGPMAVSPRSQRQGIGSALVTHGLARLQDVACPFVVVIGHPSFYARFGFSSAAALGMTCDWDVPADVFMVKVLNPRLSGRLAGRVHYRQEFSTIA